MRDLTVVVACYNMRREAPRTLYSLSRRYQREIDDLDYEVIVVDNGSQEALSASEVAAFGPEFSYSYRDTRSASPAAAINAAVAASTGRQVAVCIDGARMHSPRTLHFLHQASLLHPRSLVATLAWQLGEKLQRIAMLEGYDQAVEDRLLASVDWENDGYELFRISCLGASSAGGWFAPIAESGCLSMSRGMFDELGGYDEAFASAGGGCVNIDFYRRACDLPRTRLVVLLGEGTFHQFHGSAATGSGGRDQVRRKFALEYQRLRGELPARPDKAAIYLGSLPEQARRFL